MRKWNLVNQSIEAHALRSLALDKLGREQEASHCLDETLSSGSTWRAGCGPSSNWDHRWLRSWPVRNSGSEQLISASMCCLCSIVSLRRDRFQRHLGQSLTMNSDGAIREPLTNREVAILELLAQRLQNKVIAMRAVCFARDGEESPEANISKARRSQSSRRRGDCQADIGRPLKDRAGHRQLTPLFPSLRGFTIRWSARSLRESVLLSNRR